MFYLHLSPFEGDASLSLPRSTRPESSTPGRLPGDRAPGLCLLRPWQPRIQAQTSHRIASSFERREAEDPADAFSPKLRRKLLHYIPEVESAGSRGAYLDLSGCGRLFPDFRSLLRRIADDAAQCGHPWIRAGEGHSRLVARLAAQVALPRSYWSISTGTESSFLAPFPLLCSDRIREGFLERLDRLGVHRFGDLSGLPASLIRQALGDEGLLLWEEARGRGESGLRGRCEQVWEESCHFEPPMSDPRWVISSVRILADRLAGRLQEQGMRAGGIVLFLRYHGGGHWEGRRGLQASRQDGDDLRKTALAVAALAPERRTAVISCRIRLRDVRIRTALVQELPFCREKAGLADSLRRIRQRFGSGAIQWSSELWMRQQGCESE